MRRLRINYFVFLRKMFAKGSRADQMREQLKHLS